MDSSEPDMDEAARLGINRPRFITRGGTVGAGLLLPGALAACGSSSSGGSSSGALKIGM